ncbi:MAG TPA: hypothetical protein VMO26_08790 [Vicinamibacterales bacterium]|nr:hypothetical protein [Vicinamibacterales bacterium]
MARVIARKLLPGGRLFVTNSTTSGSRTREWTAGSFMVMLRK